MNTDKNAEQKKNLALTKEKALAINLDPSIYGTVVEIGAGQEVARQFFSAGAAAGTVAKTMSAYDMQVSDDVYGKAGRYVSRERVGQMLQIEFDLLIQRLSKTRDIESKFFAYAATVTARSYSQRNECHGWIGVRRQSTHGGEASEVVLHVRMLDNTNTEQSDALGILGVNLIHGVYHHSHSPKKLIDCLQDGMGSSNRIEVDLIEFSGPDFSGVENRLMNLHLIRSWSCRAVMFDSQGQSIVPAAALRKKDTVVIRGSFKPPTNVHIDMRTAAQKAFLQEDGVERDKVLVVAEITMNELSAADDAADTDFLARVDLLTELGFSVLVSDYLRFFRLRSWIRRYTNNRIGIVLSVLDFSYLFDLEYYDGLEGGILEAMGKLFSDNTNVYVYPTIRDGKLVTLDNVDITPNLRHLLTHLVHNKRMVSADIIDVKNLEISARELIKQIPKGDGDWQTKIPKTTANSIKKHGLFGYPKVV